MVILGDGIMQKLSLYCGGFINYRTREKKVKTHLENELKVTSNSEGYHLTVYKTLS